MADRNMTVDDYRLSVRDLTNKSTNRPSAADEQRRTDLLRELRKCADGIRWVKGFADLTPMERARLVLKQHDIAHELADAAEFDDPQKKEK